MLKLGILKVTALSLALAAATPAFAAGFRGGAKYVGSGGSRVAQTSTGSVVSSDAYCRSLGAYYDSTSREYMDGTGLWSPCP
jgi:hypothetical protein